MSRRPIVLIVLALLALPVATAAGEPETSPAPVTTEQELRDTLAALSLDDSGPHTVTLGADITIAGTEELVYSGEQALTIDGQGLYALDGGGNSRVLRAANVLTGALTIRDVTIRNGSATNDAGVSWLGPVTVEGSVFHDNHAGATSGVASAGAVGANGSMTIVDSVFRDNAAVSSGGNGNAGAVDVSGGDATLTITRSTFTGNRAEGSNSGAAGAARSLGTMTVTDSVFHDNAAVGVGAAAGAVSATDLVTAEGSLFVGNRVTSSTASASGGALYSLFGAVDVLDSSVIDNSVESTSALARGSAVYAGADLTLRNTTVAENSTTTSGGASDASVRSGGSVTLAHVAVVANTDTTGAVVGVEAAADLEAEASVVSGGDLPSCSIGGQTVSDGHNYSTGGTCGFDGPGDVDAGSRVRMTVRDNGDLDPPGAPGLETNRPTGFAYTYGNDFDSGSPLVDAIAPADCTDDPDLADDERGLPRPHGAGCDIGAIEAVFPAHGFSDVTPYFEDTVRWITSPVNVPNILDGYNDGTFRTSTPISRGQAARLYYRAYGQPAVDALPAHGFSDVSPFFEDSVRWAKANGIFDGYADGTFRQANPISRGNFVRSLYNLAGEPDVDGLTGHGLTDVTPYFEDSVRWAKFHEVMDGYANGTFRSSNDITRGNATRAVYNLARRPTAWQDEELAPASMLFRSNLT